MAPDRPGWWWARQLANNASCGWRPVRVSPPFHSYPMKVSNFGDRERLNRPERLDSWEWGPRIEEPEGSDADEPS